LKTWNAGALETTMDGLVPFCAGTPCVCALTVNVSATSSCTVVVKTPLASVPVDAASAALPVFASVILVLESCVRGLLLASRPVTVMVTSSCATGFVFDAATR
jgi:hypothetical protein